jgi:hypothetical protein
LIAEGCPARGPPQIFVFFRLPRSPTGVDPARSPTDSPSTASPPDFHLDRAVARLEAFARRYPIAGGIDPHVINGFFAAAMLGWFAFSRSLS